MGSTARKKCAGSLSGEPTVCQILGRTKPAPTKDRKQERVVGKLQWSQQGVYERLPLGNKRIKQLTIRASIAAKHRACCLDRALDDDSCSVVERVGKRGWRLDPLKAMLSKRQGTKER
jgi:hypothetical protein